MIHATRPGAPARNGLVPPVRRHYRWRARRPAWMLAALAAAEHQHGPPVPTCRCGEPLEFRSGYATCTACGYRTGGEKW